MSQETKILTAIGIITAAIIVIGAFTLGGKTSTNPNQPTTINKDQTKLLVRPQSHQTESQNTKVNIVEFGDFQCPACGAAYPTVKRLQQEYKGKVNFVFREFPLPAHPNGHNAALAAEAAGAQGKFWEMFDKLYSTQNDWSDAQDPLNTYTSYAKDLGLNLDKFKSDYQTKKYDPQIQADQNDGNALGVNATPTFFVNNEMIVGVISYDDFKKKIDTALNKK